MNDPVVEQEADPLDQLDDKWKDFDFSNAIGLLLLIQEIQNQKPLDDPNILKIDPDGTPLY